MYRMKDNAAYNSGMERSFEYTVSIGPTRLHVGQCCPHWRGDWSTGHSSVLPSANLYPTHRCWQVFITELREYEREVCSAGHIIGFAATHLRRDSGAPGNLMHRTHWYCTRVAISGRDADSRRCLAGRPSAQCCEMLCVGIIRRRTVCRSERAHCRRCWNLRAFSNN